MWMQSFASAAERGSGVTGDSALRELLGIGVDPKRRLVRRTRGDQHLYSPEAVEQGRFERCSCQPNALEESPQLFRPRLDVMFAGKVEGLPDLGEGDFVRPRVGTIAPL